MTTDQYHQLLLQFCTAAGLSEPDRLIRTGVIRIGGTDMLLRHDARNAPDRLQVRLDFGLPPRERRERLHALLLATNFITSDYAGFSIHPQEGNVVLHMQFALSPDWTGQNLLRTLQKVSAEGRQLWTRTLASLSSLSPRTKTDATTQAKMQALNRRSGRL